MDKYTKLIQQIEYDLGFLYWRSNITNDEENEKQLGHAHSLVCEVMQRLKIQFIDKAYKDYDIS